MARVDQIIAERTSARSTALRADAGAVVAGIAGRYLGQSESRLRAALVLLAARAGEENPSHGEPENTRALHAAAAVALIYAASQVHAELIDAGDRRSGTVARQPRWGGSATLMVGDYLLALAAAELALAPDPQIITSYSRSVMAICEGRIAPVTDVTPLELARSQALHYAETTTAALVEAATTAGAVCAGLAPSHTAALARYGRDLGMALQLDADGRDYEGPGAALRGGVITLPLIYAAEAGGPAIAALLNQSHADASLNTALADVRRLGGVARTRDDMREYAGRAAAHLAPLPLSVARDALAAIAETIA